MHERGVALLLLVRHTIHECLQRWCPLGSVQPAGGMAQLALELKNAASTPAAFNFSMTAGAMDGGKSLSVVHTRAVGLHPGKSFSASKRTDARRMTTRVGVKLFRHASGGAGSRFRGP
jgi:hypothetical protein